MPLKLMIIWLFSTLAAGAWGENMIVAVASNFAIPMKEIADRFGRHTGHTMTLSFGSSGKLYAQITHGAPFAVFLSADQDKPEALESSGLVVAGSRFTYALGRLALWSGDRDLADPRAVLEDGDFRRLAIANPRVAPYGQAAAEVLENLGLGNRFDHKLVYGENIAQTYQFVATGNAALGFVALSQVYENEVFPRGSGWVVPAGVHGPIRQDAVLLARGANNPAARALLDFLKTPEARDLIRHYGYGVPVAE